MQTQEAVERFENLERSILQTVATLYFMDRAAREHHDNGMGEYGDGPEVPKDVGRDAHGVMTSLLSYYRRVAKKLDHETFFDKDPSRTNARDVAYYFYENDWSVDSHTDAQAEQRTEGHSTARAMRYVDRHFTASEAGNERFKIVVKNGRQLRNDVEEIDRALDNRA